MMPSKTLLTKDNAYAILKEFSKEFHRDNRNTLLEIVVVGGGSILLNYGFRENTQDMDITTGSMGEVKTAAYRVADKLK